MMGDTHPLLAAAGLISGIVGGLIAAWTTWRKDQREHDQAPITIQDALLTQSGAAMNRMVARTKTADERAARLDAENDHLRDEVATEHAARLSTSYQLEECLATSRAWVDFGTWLKSRWQDIRESSVPPTMPGDGQHGTGWYYPQHEKD